MTRLRYWQYFFRIRHRLNECYALHFHDYGTFLDWFFPVRLVVRRPVYAMTFHGFDSWPISARHRLGRAVAAACMDVTFGVGSYIREFYSHRIDNYFLGAPVRPPLRIDRTERNRFLFVGRFEADTAIDRFAECLRAACDSSGMQASLICIGDGSLAESLRRCAGSSLSVQLLAPTLETDGEMARADVVVGTGFLSLMDAFQNRKTVVVPAFTPMKQAYIRSIDAAGDLCYVATTEGDCSRILESLVRQPDSPERETKKNSAAAFARSQSWRAIAEQHLRAYERKAGAA